MWIHLLELLTTTFACVISLFVILWLSSIALNDVSIVDRFWAIGCTVPGWVAFYIADGAAFPSLPSKSITISLAAHATRVARNARL